MSEQDVLVLGAGMVGTCTALHLQARGWQVKLVDRKLPGQETSYGNAGIIQREAVEPYAFPLSVAELSDALLGRSSAVSWHLSGVVRTAPALARYALHSTGSRYQQASRGHSQLIAHALSEHEGLIAAAGAEDLVKREGFRFVFRSGAALDEAITDAQRKARDYGVRSQVMDGGQLAQAEPILRERMAGAIHWLDPWTVSDPGALVQRYADLFVQRGGEVVQGDVSALTSNGRGWRVVTQQGSMSAAHAVVAMGPWSARWAARLGYAMPLFVKRGYHQHYASEVPLNLPMLDTDNGYVAAPMRLGVRLTTGAELALQDAPDSPVQLRQVTSRAQTLMKLGDAQAPQHWRGARPCTSDMLPVIGAASKHPGLWFNFGHAHQGFTLGPVSGRLLAESMAGEPTVVDPVHYLPSRFGR